VRSTVFLAFEMEAGNAAEDLEPPRRVAPNLDLRLDGAKGVERLIEQIAHHANLRPIPRRADIVNRQPVVNTQVTLDEAGHLPVVDATVEPLEDEDVTSTRRAAVAFAAPPLIGVRQGCGNRIAQRRGVGRFGGADAIRQPSFFHASPCLSTA
jgi:hypothetical protein